MGRWDAGDCLLLLLVSLNKYLRYRGASHPTSVVHYLAFAHVKLWFQWIGEGIELSSQIMEMIVTPFEWRAVASHTPLIETLKRWPQVTRPASRAH